MSADERTRYDRQVRLWGKATQQQLQLTEVRVNGVASATAEVAKNLVLAGVRSVVVEDESTIDATDLKTSFLVQGCDIGQSRGGASTKRLQSLNPYVAVHLAQNTDGARAVTTTGAPFRVTIARFKSIAEAFQEIHNPQNTVTDLVVLVANLGYLTMGLLLPRRGKFLYKEQLNLLLETNVSCRPAVFQRSLLLLRMMECPAGLTFFERLAFASGVVVKHNLKQLSREDVEFAAGVSPQHLSGTAIESTIAGGVIAQLIIHEVGSAKAALPSNESYAWAVCNNNGATNVQVGHLLPR
ncbi:ubiquitin activating enzyme [Trypanosoma grayi]|uniref:ubiquitin activating enzyme n=1 Tax=Trypanosoma grayi TaxID=71804 RepID=UPI0004F4AF9F|nr:ubiquitin activating enzyme [Trypanosoma grayi]KEG15349.1 ubiquitin activating enzyme [Trypanosoma grayi]